MSDCSKAIERNWETMIEGEGLHNVPGLELILDGMGDEVRQVGKSDMNIPIINPYEQFIEPGRLPEFFCSNYLTSHLTYLKC
jgi:hypothetical protein